ncbi:MAG: FHA domain-containing protein [Anaerolineae bacterium]|nr:FHA domain-containing protein [Anaerolineae bacterium]
MFTLKDIRSETSHPIPEQGMRIGRAAGNDLVLADEEVSRYHATVWFYGGQLYIRDEKSTNGTWVNERRIAAPTPLRPGDHIRLGRTVLEVVGREPGATVVSMMPGVGVPPPAATHPVAPPSPLAQPRPPTTPPPGPSAAPPLAPSSRLPLILGLGSAGLLLLCGLVILTIVVLRVPLPGIAPRPTPTPQDAWITIMSEDFEGDFPGQWKFEGDEEYQWGKSTCRPYTGNYSGWVIGGGTRGTSLDCGDNYQNNVKTKMVYGPFSLEGATAAELRFKLWVRTESGGDWICWSASDDGESYSGTCRSGTNEWYEEVLLLSDVPYEGSLLGLSEVWIALEFASDESNTEPDGAYVDDIVLRKCTYPGGRCR